MCILLNHELCCLVFVVELKRCFEYLNIYEYLYRYLYVFERKKLDRVDDDG